MTWEVMQPTLVRLGSILRVMRYECVWMMMEKTPLECGVVRSQAVSVSHLYCIQTYSAQESCAIDYITAITCHNITDHAYTSITYPPRTSSSFPIGARAFYTINCPEGMERNGGDNVRICNTGDGRSAVGVWSGTPPTCTGIGIS